MQTMQKSWPQTVLCSQRIVAWTKFSGIFRYFAHLNVTKHCFCPLFGRCDMQRALKINFPGAMKHFAPSKGESINRAGSYGCSAPPKRQGLYLWIHPYAEIPVLMCVYIYIYASKVPCLCIPIDDVDDIHPQALGILHLRTFSLIYI